MIKPIFLMVFCYVIIFVMVSGQSRYSKSISGPPRIGYSSNVVHGYKETDSIPESSINNNIKFPTSGNSLLTKTNNVPSNVFTRTSYLNEAKGGNLFNVGYDLKFKEPSVVTPSLLFQTARNKEINFVPSSSSSSFGTTKKFEHAEVITGKLKRNEKVRAPSNSDFSTKDFVTNAFLQQKNNNKSPPNTRLTTSPISAANNNNNNLKFSTVFNQYPNSQTFPYNNNNNNNPQTNRLAEQSQINLQSYQTNSHNNNNNWYYNNKQEPQVYQSRAEPTIDAQSFASFNHDFALKNSESFDFKDAHGKIDFGDDNNNNNKEIIIDDAIAAGSDNIDIVTQSPNFDINNINIEAHIPHNLRGVEPLPLDTSLLKIDPVLTTNFQEIAKKQPQGNVIPIHFDVRQIQNAAMQTEIGKVHNFVPPYQENNNNNYGYLQQNNEAGNINNNNKQQFNVGINYGKEQKANYEEDIYRIVSLRPPPIMHNYRY